MNTPFGISPAASVMISGYERIFALCVSLTLAVSGATYLFGNFNFDLRITGFSQNPNAFTFVLLIALAAGLALQERLRWGTAIIATILSAVTYTGSRAGFVAAPTMIACALLCGVKLRPLVNALALAAAILSTLAVLPLTMGTEGGPNAVALWQALGSTSDQQHLQTVWDGLGIFMRHPLFGAGLGAYMAEQINSTGVPLMIHSTTVWLLAECGLAGFAVFAHAGWKIFATEFARRHELAARAIILALVGFGIMGQAHDLLYQRALWLLLGAALAIPSTAAISVKDDTAQPVRESAYAA
jgi:hypothetical protein